MVEGQTDVMTKIAAEYFNIPYEQVTREQRILMKRRYHAMNYSYGTKVMQELLTRESQINANPSS